MCVPCHDTVLLASLHMRGALLADQHPERESQATDYQLDIPTASHGRQKRHRSGASLPGEAGSLQSNAHPELGREPTPHAVLMGDNVSLVDHAPQLVTCLHAATC